MENINFYFFKIKYNTLFRLFIAFIIFISLGFIALLILKALFPPGYDPVTAVNTGYFLLMIIVICIIIADVKLQKYFSSIENE